MGAAGVQGNSNIAMPGIAVVRAIAMKHSSLFRINRYFCWNLVQESSFAAGRRQKRLGARCPGAPLRTLHGSRRRTCPHPDITLAPGGGGGLRVMGLSGFRDFKV